MRLYFSIASLTALFGKTSAQEIGIKTNLLSAAAPEKAATTHPALLTALTELLLENQVQLLLY